MSGGNEAVDGNTHEVKPGSKNEITVSSLQSLVPKDLSPKNILETISLTTHSPLNTLDTSSYNSYIIQASHQIDTHRILRKKDQNTQLPTMYPLRDYQKLLRRLCTNCPQSMFPLGYKKP